MRKWVEKGSKVTANTARRVTGISTPLGGLQWADPGPSDGEIVRRLLVFLEDRRVLYNAAHLEGTSQVAYSLGEIRKACTEALQALAPAAFATTPIRAVREACRRFQDDQHEEFRFFDHRHGRDPHETRGHPGFFVALGAFRATVGQQVAFLAAHYDIDIDGDLATILPRPEEEKE